MSIDFRGTLDELWTVKKEEAHDKRTLETLEVYRIKSNRQAAPQKLVEALCASKDEEDK